MERDRQTNREGERERVSVSNRYNGNLSTTNKQSSLRLTNVELISPTLTPTSEPITCCSSPIAIDSTEV